MPSLTFPARLVLAAVTAATGIAAAVAAPAPAEAAPTLERSTVQRPAARADHGDGLLAHVAHELPGEVLVAGTSDTAARQVTVDGHRGVVTGDQIIIDLDAPTGDPPADSPQGPASSHDGHGPVAAANGAPTGAAGAGGYRQMVTHKAARDAYTVHIVGGPGSEWVRPYLDAAIRDASAASNVHLSVAPGRTPQMTFTPGRIEVQVTDSQPCGAAAIGCGGPATSAGQISSGRIWISPRAVHLSAANKHNLARHELGHVFGLAHHDGTHAGRRQVMHSTLGGVASYQSGDRNGLALVNPALHRPAASVTTIGYHAGAVHAAGSATDPNGAVTAVTVTVAGRSQQVRALNGRWNVTVPGVAGGRVDVCAAAHNVGAGATPSPTCRAHAAPTAPFGNLDLVEASGLGVRVAGWAVDPQTAEAVDVTVTVGSSSSSRSASRDREGLPIDASYGMGHGFDVTVPAADGQHRVCVHAEPAGPGPRTTLGCRDVTVALLGTGGLADVIGGVTDAGAPGGIGDLGGTVGGLVDGLTGGTEVPSGPAAPLLDTVTGTVDDVLAPLGAGGKGLLGGLGGR